MKSYDDIADASVEAERCTKVAIDARAPQENICLCMYVYVIMCVLCVCGHVCACVSLCVRTQLHQESGRDVSVLLPHLR